LTGGTIPNVIASPATARSIAPEQVADFTRMTKLSGPIPSPKRQHAGFGAKVFYRDLTAPGPNLLPEVFRFTL
jgi:hypothetical protein